MLSLWLAKLRNIWNFVTTKQLTFNVRFWQHKCLPCSNVFMMHTRWFILLYTLDSLQYIFVKEKSQIFFFAVSVQSRFELRPIKKQYIFGNLNGILKEILEKVGIRDEVTHWLIVHNIKSFHLQKGQNYVHFVIEWPPHSQ